jgi:hypothetical protein
VSLPAGTLGLLALAGEHADLTVSDDVDVLVLDDASPTARFSGLVGAQPLDQASPGLFARTRMAAALEIYETAPAARPRPAADGGLVTPRPIDVPSVQATLGLWTSCWAGCAWSGRSTAPDSGRTCCSA